ncbi:MAG: hypothetical protein AAFV72_10290 [Cyanobacteria bacterium J06635_1]
MGTGSKTRTTVISGIILSWGVILRWTGYAIAQEPTGPFPLPALASEPNSILIAAPQNLNPGLYQPPPIPEVAPVNEPENEIPPPDSEASDEPSASAILWEDLELDISDSFSNFGQANRLVTPTLRGQLPNGNTVSVAPGFNRFAQTDLETVYHVPLTVGWQGQLDEVSLKVGGGLDFFNRLPVAAHFDAKASIPIGPGATLSMTVEQGPYLFNAETLENQISAWRYGPDLYWQIDPHTSFFSLLRLGHYSDGNWEQQSFSRLERRLGDEAALSLNVFNWHFQQDLEQSSGYFSPPDFLVATAELTWQKEIVEELSCGLSGSLGQQRLEGDWTLAYNYQALCTVDITPSLQADLGYRFSNVSHGQSGLAGESAYNNRQILAGVRSQF